MHNAYIFKMCLLQHLRGYKIAAYKMQGLKNVYIMIMEGAIWYVVEFYMIIHPRSMDLSPHRTCKRFFFQLAWSLHNNLKVRIVLKENIHFINVKLSSKCGDLLCAYEHCPKKFTFFMNFS